MPALGKLQDVLEDLASRFLINLPPEEQKSLERICFQVEQAHWFYDDFLRPEDPSLPGFAAKAFCSALLRASGIELDGDPATAYDRFLKYKFAVPVCGAIMLNETLDKVVLVRGFKNNSSWTFPRGKINQNESDRDCAVREVWEETGYDLSPHFDPSIQPADAASKVGPAPLPTDIDLDDRIEVGTHSGDSKVKLFIVPGVPEDTIFETRTRGEIGKIGWFPIKALDTARGGGVTSGDEQLAGKKFYMVSSAIRPWRAWIKRYRKLQKGRDRSVSVSPLPPPPQVNDAYVDIDEASKALQALFFGADHGKPNKPIASEPGDVKILRRSQTPPQRSQPGLLDEQDRKRKQDSILSDLLAIVKSDAPSVEQTQGSQDLLSVLFDRAKAERRASNPSQPLPRQQADASLLSIPQAPRSGRDPQPVSNGFVQPPHPYPMAPPLLPPLAGLPPPSMLMSRPPEMSAPSFMGVATPMGTGYNPMSLPSVSLPPHHSMPVLYQPPPSAVTVSSAGPPLQPTPRRPITLLDVPTPPPGGPTAVNTRANADALLSLLNVGGRGPLGTAGQARL